VDAFYTERGALASLGETERLGYYLRKALVHFAAVTRYEKENFNDAAKKTYIGWERDSAAAALKEALRMGDSLAAKAENKDDRGIARDRILAHFHLATLSTQLADPKKAASHLREAQALFDALVQAGPFSAAQLADWMDLPNLYLAIGDLGEAAGDKAAVRDCYQKAMALQTLLVARSPQDEARKAALETIKQHLREALPPAPAAPVKPRKR
jgi:hypothetical protein